MSDAHLQWVHYNRGEPGARPRPPVENERTRRRERAEATRRGGTTEAGRLVKQAMRDRQQLSELERRLLAVLDDKGGADLVGKVRTLGVRRGVLRIETSDVVTVYDLRLRWEQQILRAVQRQVPEAGVRAVRFTLLRSRD